MCVCTERDRESECVYQTRVGSVLRSATFPLTAVHAVIRMLSLDDFVPDRTNEEYCLK